MQTRSTGSTEQKQIVKDLIAIPESSSLIVKLGDYSVYNEENEDGNFEVVIYGKSRTSLSSMPRCAIAMSIRTGAEIKSQESEFSKAFNIEDDIFYASISFLVGKNEDGIPTFLFKNYNDALIFHNLIVRFKSTSIEKSNFNEFFNIK